MGAYELLLKAVRSRNIFQRNKLPLERKVLACLLYMAGLSYRAMTFRTGLIEASHVAVHYWFHKLKGLICDEPPKVRRCVAVDESKLKEDGYQLFIWSAIDVDTKEYLAVYASYQRSSLNAYLFMRKVLVRCVGKPLILVDGGPWYSWVLDRLGLRWEHVTFGRRNPIERLFRTVKERTKGFYNNIPARVHKLVNVTFFLEIFAFWYNHLRRHESLGRVPTEVTLF